MLAKRNLLYLVFAVLILTLCSCAPSLVGTDAAVYSTGKLYAVSGRDLTEVYQASLKALEDLEIRVTQHQKDIFSAKIVAKAADGKVIKIIAKPAKPDLTNLDIKVGLLGDEERSRLIYERIRQNLGF